MAAHETMAGASSSIPDDSPLAVALTRYLSVPSVARWLLTNKPVLDVPAAALERSFVYAIAFSSSLRARRAAAAATNATHEDLLRRTMDVEDMLIVCAITPEKFALGCVYGLAQPHVFAKTPLMGQTRPVTRRFAVDLNATECLEFMEILHFDDGKMYCCFRQFLHTPDGSLPVAARATLHAPGPLFSARARRKALHLANANAATTRDACNTHSASLGLHENESTPSRASQRDQALNLAQVDDSVDDNDEDIDAAIIADTIAKAPSPAHVLGNLLMSADIFESLTCPMCGFDNYACSCPFEAKAAVGRRHVTTRNWSHFTSKFMSKSRNGRIRMTMSAYVPAMGRIEVLNNELESLNILLQGQNDYMTLMRRKAVHGLGINVVMPRADTPLVAPAVEADFINMHNQFVSQSSERRRRKRAIEYRSATSPYALSESTGATGNDTNAIATSLTPGPFESLSCVARSQYNDGATGTGHVVGYPETAMTTHTTGEHARETRPRRDYRYEFEGGRNVLPEDLDAAFRAVAAAAVASASVSNEQSHTGSLESFAEMSSAGAGHLVGTGTLPTVAEGSDRAESLPTGHTAQVFAGSEGRNIVQELQPSQAPPPALLNGDIAGAYSCGQERIDTTAREHTGLSPWDVNTIGLMSRIDETEASIEAFAKAAASTSHDAHQSDSASSAMSQPRGANFVPRATAPAVQNVPANNPQELTSAVDELIALSSRMHSVTGLGRGDAAVAADGASQTDHAHVVPTGKEASANAELEVTLEGVRNEWEELVRQSIQSQAGTGIVDAFGNVETRNTTKSHTGAANVSGIKGPAATGKPDGTPVPCLGSTQQDHPTPTTVLPNAAVPRLDGIAFDLTLGNVNMEHVNGGHGSSIGGQDAENHRQGAANASSGAATNVPSAILGSRSVTGGPSNTPAVENGPSRPPPASKRKPSNAQTAASVEDGRKHACSLCSSRFKMRGDLLRHVRVVHEKKKVHVCTTCGKSFGHSGHLNRHQASHRGERRFKCELCGFQFFQASHLASHVQHVHSSAKGRRHECTLCRMRLPKVADLCEHLRSVHGIGRNCHIDGCGAVLDSEVELIEHMKEHVSSSSRSSQEEAAALQRRRLVEGGR